jgi:hypothetical protein
MESFTNGQQVLWRGEPATVIRSEWVPTSYPPYGWVCYTIRTAGGPEIPAQPCELTAVPEEKMTVWWVAGEATHGERGLACVSEPWSLEGIGALHPDAVYAGSPASFVRYLRHLGYTQLDVDDEAPLAAKIRSEWSCAPPQ